MYTFTMRRNLTKLFLVAFLKKKLQAEPTFRTLMVRPKKRIKYISTNLLLLVLVFVKLQYVFYLTRRDIYYNKKSVQEKKKKKRLCPRWGNKSTLCRSVHNGFGNETFITINANKIKPFKVLYHLSSRFF